MAGGTWSAAPAAAVDRPVRRNVTAGLEMRALVDMADDHAHINEGRERDGPEGAGPPRLVQGDKEDHSADTPEQPPRSQSESQSQRTACLRRLTPGTHHHASPTSNVPPDALRSASL